LTVQRTTTAPQSCSDFANAHSSGMDNDVAHSSYTAVHCMEGLMNYQRDHSDGIPAVARNIVTIESHLWTSSGDCVELNTMMGYDIRS
jgi:hypothetical protein